MEKKMALPEELYDVFFVTQLTRGTVFENFVAVDWVRVDPWKCSQKHRHNETETVLFIERGSGFIEVNDERHLVKARDQLYIPIGAWHCVSAFQDGLVFISIQSPPIHDEAAGRHDLESFPEQENREPLKMEYLLPEFLNSETFAAWQKRYRMKCTVTQKEITVEIEPFPPDTMM